MKPTNTELEQKLPINQINNMKLKCPNCGEVATFSRIFSTHKYWTAPLLLDTESAAESGDVFLYEDEWQAYPKHRYDGQLNEASVETYCDKCEVEVQDNEIELVKE